MLGEIRTNRIYSPVVMPPSMRPPANAGGNADIGEVCPTEFRPSMRPPANAGGNQESPVGASVFYGPFNEAPSKCWGKWRNMR